MFIMTGGVVTIGGMPGFYDRGVVSMKVGHGGMECKLRDKFKFLGFILLLLGLVVESMILWYTSFLIKCNQVGGIVLS